MAKPHQQDFGGGGVNEYVGGPLGPNCRLQVARKRPPTKTAALAAVLFCKEVKQLLDALTQILIQARLEFVFRSIQFFVVTG